ncbi:YidC/Oxa1 family membrane protein insertase, partial [Staphylococcus aureus]|nr:YidC/Oxa1 family membrane protein insertase [Staphylococcus aureus]
DYSKPEKRSGFFYNTFVDPMKNVLDWLGNNLLNDNYGLAIIILVLVIRIILLPFMLSNYKNSHMMRQKMKVAKPEVEKIQEKVKRARTQEEKMAANQELMQAYVSSKTMPDEQRQMGYMMMVISPIMIIWISLSSASALGLYWSVSAAFLVVQTHFANIYYEKVAKKEVQPFIEAYEREHNGGSNKKGKNTQVVSKKKKK